MKFSGLDPAAQAAIIAGSIGLMGVLINIVITLGFQARQAGKERQHRERMAFLDQLAPARLKAQTQLIGRINGVYDFLSAELEPQWLVAYLKQQPTEEDQKVMGQLKARMDKIVEWLQGQELVVGSNTMLQFQEWYQFMRSSLGMLKGQHPLVGIEVTHSIVDEMNRVTNDLASAIMEDWKVVSMEIPRVEERNEANKRGVEKVITAYKRLQTNKRLTFMLQRQNQEKEAMEQIEKTIKRLRQIRHRMDEPMLRLGEAERSEG